MIPYLGRAPDDHCDCCSPHCEGDHPPCADAPTVCLTHWSFIPCRHRKDGERCILSQNEWHVAWVRAYQST